MGSPDISPRTEYGHTFTSTLKSPLRTSSPRCTQCNTGPVEGNGRNLIVCIDGTSNQFGQTNTNVVKLFAKINLETIQPKQFAYYSSGIGTRPKSMHILDRGERIVSDKFDMAIAWNVEEIVRDAYSWLARMYQEGDQIYLFGFSRGAYQVRVLAGMIHEVGLLRTLTEKQVGTAYDHYEAIRPGQSQSKAKQNAREFKNTFSWRDLRVHFVGVWDTVSSVGLIRGDVSMSSSSTAVHACHFRHALALDELRVKFMPEYLHEMNTQINTRNSKHVVPSPSAEPATSPSTEWRESTTSDKSTGSSTGNKKRTTEIKEVWFAGSHSDVGGKNRPGKSYLSGNASLLWMRREAAANGLVLWPTDIVWVPDDLDFGVSNSMSLSWKIIEYIPIKHQVFFSGAGNNDRRRPHRQQPRRIIPGQKIHASILSANAYNPQATQGEGFGIPSIQTELDDAKLDDSIWETSLFDETAAQGLVESLVSQQGVAPIYLDRLLFMLRFEEGKQCVRNVSGWEAQFSTLFNDPKCPPLVRLVSIVASYEASIGTHPGSSKFSNDEFRQRVFGDAKACLGTILRQHKIRDGPRVAALLRPLTKYQALRENILTEHVEVLVGLLEQVIKHPEGNFGQAMDGLNCLLRCKETREVTIRGLGAKSPPDSNVSRLSRILEVNDQYRIDQPRADRRREDQRRLIAALRMVLTLARFPDEAARALCSEVKPKIRKLAKTDDRLIGPLAVEISLTLYDPHDQVQLDINDRRIRPNLASALISLNATKQSSTDGRHSTDGQSSVNGQGSAGGQGSANEHDPNDDPAKAILSRLFGFGNSSLQPQHKKLLGELTKAVEKGNTRERAAATLTLLKLCKTGAIRAYLLSINLLDIFIDKLQWKDSALLAAYALVTCLEYDDMKYIKSDDRFPKYVVGMLRLDYFDGVVGPVEGFQIFGDIMQHADLREKIKRYNITEVLNVKLERGQEREVRTSLVCLDIFRSFDPDGPWTRELVSKSLEHLENPEWKNQKAGVAILSALAQTEHGVNAINPRIHEIIGMLLPDGYLPIEPDAPAETQASQLSPSEGQMGPVPTIAESADVLPRPPSDVLAKPPSGMLGPACALRILARNEKLRDCARNTSQYGSLKYLYQSGALIDNTDTSAWRVKTPNRGDVTAMVDKMIRAVDGELSEEGLMSIGDAVLPHIQHWDRLMTMLRDQTLAIITILPALLGVSALAIIAVALAAPVYLSLKGYDFVKRLLSTRQNTRALDGLRLPGQDTGATPGEQGAVTAQGDHQREATSGGEDAPGPSGERGERLSRRQDRYTEDGRDAPRGITVSVRQDS